MITSFFLFAVSAYAQQLPGNWPASFQAPATNASWTDAILAGQSIPALPVTAEGTTIWDTTGEYVACIGNPNYWSLTYDDGPVWLALDLSEEILQ